MSGHSIIVEGISKKYKIGAAIDPTLRGTLRSLFGSNSPADDFWALTDINFKIAHGEAIGIVGENGSGKSTLLKILSKITYPTLGKATVYGRVASLLEVGTGFHPELSGRENIFLNGSLLGMTRSEIKDAFDEIVDFSGIELFLDTPVKRYSSGMYVRLAFAVAAHLRSEILLIDEVLAVGDAEFQKKCLGKMENVVSSGRTIMFVSHQLGLVKSICDKIIHLGKGKMQGMVPAQDFQLDTLITNAAIKRFDSGVLKAVAVSVSDQIVIKASYRFDSPTQVPHLGFIIHDLEGNALFGTNPTLTKSMPVLQKEGTAIATVLRPQLNYGTFFLTVIFGDGTTDLAHLDKVLKFTVPAAKKFRVGGYLKESVDFSYAPFEQL